MVELKKKSRMTLGYTEFEFYGVLVDFPRTSGVNRPRMVVSKTKYPDLPWTLER